MTTVHKTIYQGDTSELVFSFSNLVPVSEFEGDPSELETITDEGIQYYIVPKNDEHLVPIETGGSSELTASEVRDLYESNDDRNAKRLFWRVFSTNANFLLKMVSFDWMSRERR